jgi:hypothetical protein
MTGMTTLPPTRMAKGRTSLVYATVVQNRKLLRQTSRSLEDALHFNLILGKNDPIVPEALRVRQE